jgi:hypothetical protein
MSAVEPTGDETTPSTPKPSNEAMSRRARIGGFARAAAMTFEEQSEAGRKAVAARWDRENAKREALGLPPHRPTPQPLDDDVLRYWLDRVDDLYPDRVFANRMQRRRLAITLARQEAARVAAEVFDRNERGNA